MTYGSESWSLTSAEENILAVVEGTMERECLECLTATTFDNQTLRNELREGHCRNHERKQNE